MLKMPYIIVATHVTSGGAVKRETYGIIAFLLPLSTTDCRPARALYTLEIVPQVPHRTINETSESENI